MSRIATRSLAGVGAAAAAVVLLCGCGGHRAASQTDTRRAVAPHAAACRVMATAAVDDSRALLHAYAGDAYPGDLSFYELRSELGYGQHAGCSIPELGRTLHSGLSTAQFRRLLGHLPVSYRRYLRQAVACARTAEPAPGCAHPAALIEPPGAGTISGTAHPYTP